MTTLTIQQLRDKRNDLAKEARNIIENHGDKTWTKDEQAKVDAIYDQITRTDEATDRLSKLLNIETAPVYSPGAADAPKATLDATDQKEKRLAQNMLRAWSVGGIQNAQKLIETKPDLYSQFGPAIQAASVSPGSAGGFTVPTILVPTLLERLRRFGGMREFGQSISTAGGEPLAWPTMDDSLEEGEIVAENALATDSDLVFGTSNLGAFKYSSKVVPVSFELLQDSAIDVDSLVFNALGTRIGRIQNRHFTTGTGTGQPMGAVTAAAVGKLGATGQTVSVTYDDVVDLEHAVDPSYRMMNAKYMFHDLTHRQIRKLKDSAGRPLYIPAVAGVFGQSGLATLNGYPIVINQQMPVMAANAKSILFGAGEKYQIRDVMTVTLFRFSDSAYVRRGQIGFMAWARADGRVVDATGATAGSSVAIQAYQNSAT